MVWMILFLGIWVNIKLGSELIKGALNGFLKLMVFKVFVW